MTSRVPDSRYLFSTTAPRWHHAQYIMHFGWALPGRGEHPNYGCHKNLLNPCSFPTLASPRGFEFRRGGTTQDLKDQRFSSSVLQSVGIVALHVYTSPSDVRYGTVQVSKACLCVFGMLLVSCRSLLFASKGLPMMFLMPNVSSPLYQGCIELNRLGVFV